MLHDGKADQQHEQHQTAIERRRREIVADVPGHHEEAAPYPAQQQGPGRHHEDGPVEPLHRIQRDQAQPDDADQGEAESCDAGRKCGIDQCHGDSACDHGKQAGNDDRHPQAPAIEEQIDGQEQRQRPGDHHLGGGANHAIVRILDTEHLLPEAEIDAEIGQHRPAHGGGNGEHQRAADDEENGQKQCQQAGHAEHHAVIQRQTVGGVLIGFVLPQAQLRQGRPGQFDDIGDHGARIERETEQVGGRRRFTLGAEALARGDVDDTGLPEIGTEDARSAEHIVGRDQNPVELLIGIVGQRQNHPGGGLAGLAGTHLDAADDAVGTRCRGDLQPLAMTRPGIDLAGQFDGAARWRDIDNLQRPRLWRHERCKERDSQDDRPRTSHRPAQVRRWRQLCKRTLLKRRLFGARPGQDAQLHMSLA